MQRLEEVRIPEANNMAWEHHSLALNAKDRVQKAIDIGTPDANEADRKHHALLCDRWSSENRRLKDCELPVARDQWTKADMKLYNAQKEFRKAWKRANATQAALRGDQGEDQAAGEPEQGGRAPAPSESEGNQAGACQGKTREAGARARKSPPARSTRARTAAKRRQEPKREA